MVLLYASVGRSAVAGGEPFAATGWFFVGYITVWIGFSAATLAQWQLMRLGLLSSRLMATDKAVDGLILTAIGGYQCTPMKAAFLHGVLCSTGGNAPGSQRRRLLPLQSSTYACGRTDQRPQPPHRSNRLSELLRCRAGAAVSRLAWRNP